MLMTTPDTLKTCAVSEWPAEPISEKLQQSGRPEPAARIAGEH
ncbi:hypothetical protein [Polaromonas sp. CG9_12]|nr:hypothetical protein [Polaromonas sp. CG9_12]